MADQPSVVASLVPQALVLALAAGLASLLALARPHTVLAYARDHLVSIAAAAGIGAVALAVATVFTLSLRREQPARCAARRSRRRSEPTAR